MTTYADTHSTLYSEAANEFTRQIRQHSSPAADCIGQIRATYGTRAAYLAAFALLRLKRWQIDHKYAPSQKDVHAYTYCEEMGEIAEAIQLYEAAVAYLLAP